MRRLLLVIVVVCVCVPGVYGQWSIHATADTAALKTYRGVSDGAFMKLRRIASGNSEAIRYGINACSGFDKVSDFTGATISKPFWVDGMFMKAPDDDNVQEITISSVDSVAVGATTY